MDDFVGEVGQAIAVKAGGNRLDTQQLLGHQPSVDKRKGGA